MDECIFCKIINGEFDSAKVWEDDEFLAILEIMPNTKGVTLVLTKKHYDSYAFKLPEDVYLRLMSASKKVAKVLEKGLNIKRVAMVMEGMGVNHSHTKLYPLHGVKDKFNPADLPEENIFFEKYGGYVTTQRGKKADINELKKLAEEIKDKITNCLE